MIKCDYCHKEAIFSPCSSHIYSRDYGPVWECKSCQAWVGCHPNNKPLGRLANAVLRREKQKAHAVFDPLWKRKMEKCGLKKGQARAKAYKWLAAELGIERRDCHIGMFNEDMCRRVVELCAPYARPANT